MIEDIINKVLQETTDDEIIIVTNNKYRDEITVHMGIDRKTKSIKYIGIYNKHDLIEPLFILTIFIDEPEIQIPFDIYQLIYKHRYKLADIEAEINILTDTIEICSKAGDEIIPYDDIDDLWDTVRNHINILIVQESI